MEPIKQGAKHISEQMQKATSGASKETNKEVAKDSDAPIGTRVEAAKDAVGDKMEEQKHDAKAEAHKQQAKQ